MERTRLEVGQAFAMEIAARAGCALLGYALLQGCPNFHFSRIPGSLAIVSRREFQQLQLHISQVVSAEVFFFFYTIAKG